MTERYRGPKEKSTTKGGTEHSISADEKQDDTTNSQKSHGVLLHGFLKTRYVDISNHDKKSIFTFKSSWKLRYWRLVLVDDGLMFEKSRRVDTRSYKGILLPFGKTTLWENWGKRGDTKYSFGFTVRVTASNMQMESAVDSEACRRRWVNALQCAFCSNIKDPKELVKQLSQKTTETLSKATNAADEMYDNSRMLLNLQSGHLYLSHSEGSASWNELRPTAQQLLANVNQAQVNAYVATDTISVRANTYTRTDTDRNSRNRITVDDYDWKSLDEIVRDDNTIPRRYNAELYDNEGYMSDHLEKRRSPFHIDSLPDIVDGHETENDENSHSDKAKKSVKTIDNGNDGIFIVLNPKKKKD